MPRGDPNTTYRKQVESEGEERTDRESGFGQQTIPCARIAEQQVAMTDDESRIRYKSRAKLTAIDRDRESERRWQAGRRSLTGTLAVPESFDQVTREVDQGMNSCDCKVKVCSLSALHDQVGPARDENEDAKGCVDECEKVEPDEGATDGLGSVAGQLADNDDTEHESFDVFSDDTRQSARNVEDNVARGEHDRQQEGPDEDERSGEDLDGLASETARRCTEDFDEVSDGVQAPTDQAKNGEIILGRVVQCIPNPLSVSVQGLDSVVRRRRDELADIEEGIDDSREVFVKHLGRQDAKASRGRDVAVCKAEKSRPVLDELIKSRLNEERIAVDNRRAAFGDHLAAIINGPTRARDSVRDGEDNVDDPGRNQFGRGNEHAVDRIDVLDEVGRGRANEDRVKLKRGHGSGRGGEETTSSHDKRDESTVAASQRHDAEVLDCIAGRRDSRGLYSQH